MSTLEPDHTDLTPDEARALAALKQAAPPAVPVAVRERCRAAFLTGEHVPPSVARLRAAARPRLGLGWRLGAALAAAAAVALVWVGSRPTGTWHVAEVVGPQAIELAGRRPPAGRPGSAVGPGPIRVGAASELELALDTRLRLRLLSETQASLPPAPGRWFGRTRVVTVEAGEIFGATGGPLGFRLRLSTPEAEAVLSGTSFAVIRNDEATCFCLYRGALEITERARGRRLSLPLEHRVLIFRDGRPPQVEPITDRERMKLSMMDAAAGPGTTR
jgi:ferric-dicitrate binding protein FerR (iron transport regulator)